MAPEAVRKLPGAGSSRRYYILEKSADAGDDVPGRIVATCGDNPAENKAFCGIAKACGKHNEMIAPGVAQAEINVPEIYAVSEDGKCYLQSWHGSKSLMDIIKSKEEAERNKTERLLRKSIDMLVEMQTADDIPYSELVFNAPFNRRQILWDLNYFKYEFLKPCGLEFDEERLEDDFDAFADDLISMTEAAPETIGFMYRDFQSRNILVDDTDADRLTFIDFQGGRIGPVTYDIVSFLWQAKAAFPVELRRKLTDYYFQKMAERRGEAVIESLRKQERMTLVFRALQVLGAYGFRGLVERKAHFLESIVYGLDNLKIISDAGYIDNYPYLKELCGRLIAMKSKFAPERTGRLKIEVFSFSYKKGYPADYTGNGGGFMFDCRGMHNPGRYEEYKKLTGLDKPVIDFLEERGEVQRFVSDCERVVSPSVETYLRRGFSNLQIGFGCTGGQHRSVYCAQHLAERLAEKYPEAEVVLMHREQGKGFSF